MTMQTGISIKTIQTVYDSFNFVYKNMGRHKPTISNNGLVSSLDVALFTKPIAEEKWEYLQKAETFVNALNELMEATPHTMGVVPMLANKFNGVFIQDGADKWEINKRLFV